jgi:hypothetical protein
MAVEPASKSRSPSGFISARAASALCNGTCIQPFWPPIFQQINSSPRVRKSCHSPSKVRKCACGPGTNGSSNVRMRGRPCPEVWSSPVSEHVGFKVCVNPHQSRLFSLVEDGRKRGRNARTHGIDVRECSGTEESMTHFSYAHVSIYQLLCLIHNHFSTETTIRAKQNNCMITY